MFIDKVNTQLPYYGKLDCVGEVTLGTILLIDVKG